MGRYVAQRLVLLLVTLLGVLTVTFVVSRLLPGSPLTAMLGPKPTAEQIEVARLALGLDRPPWTDTRLTGLIDFPGLQATPGSRRGVVPNETAGLFSEALREVESLLLKLLAAREREKVEKLDRSLIRDLQRAFRDFYRQRPRYTMLPVQTKQNDQPGPDKSEGNEGEGAPGDEADKKSIYTKSPPPQEDLFPPGPLSEVRIIPPQLRVECGGC